MFDYVVRKLIHTAFVAFGVVSRVLVALRMSGDPAATIHPNGFGGKYWAGNQPGQRFHDLMEAARYTLDQKKRKELYMAATGIIHDEKPWLELFQEVIIYGVYKRMSFKPRPDYRLIVSEMTAAKP